MREIDRWNQDHGYVPARIDPGFDPALKSAFEAVGLGDMLHWCGPTQLNRLAPVGLNVAKESRKVDRLRGAPR